MLFNTGSKKEPLRTVTVSVGDKAEEEISCVMFQNRLEKIILVTFLLCSKIYLVAFWLKCIASIQSCAQLVCWHGKLIFTLRSFFREIQLIYKGMYTVSSSVDLLRPNIPFTSSHFPRCPFQWLSPWELLPHTTANMGLWGDGSTLLSFPMALDKRCTYLLSVHLLVHEA